MHLTRPKKTGIDRPREITPRGIPWPIHTFAAAASPDDASETEAANGMVAFGALRAAVIVSSLDEVEAVRTREFSERWC